MAKGVGQVLLGHCYQLRKGSTVSLHNVCKLIGTTEWHLVRL